MKPLVKSICAYALACFVITPLWIIAFPNAGYIEKIALCLSLWFAVNGYLWATEEGK